MEALPIITVTVPCEVGIGKVGDGKAIVTVTRAGKVAD